MNTVVKMTRGIIIPSLIFIFVLNTGCEKKEIQGPKGEAGTPGGGGNASISNSDIFTIPTSQWLTNSDNSAWQVKIESALITKNIVEKGSVKLYMRQGTGWYELPKAEGDVFMQYGFETGSVFITYMDIHGGLPAKPTTADFRIVTLSE